MKRTFFRWAPAAMMAVGAFFAVGPDMQRAISLQVPLATAIPMEIAGQVGRDITLPEDALRAGAFTEHVMRVYSSAAASPDNWSFSLYVAYYDQQMRGRTIHSPKNCMPGSGWQTLGSRVTQIDGFIQPVRVNRYILQRDQERVLVLYWYQGRGRIEPNEYKVKWDLLRDAALRRRSDEALVRIVVPVIANEDDALELGAQVARQVIPATDRALVP
jgi:EpsI family protein